MKLLTSENIIRRLIKIFATYGLPLKIVTYNGKKIITDEFEIFLKTNRIRDHKTDWCKMLALESPKWREDGVSCHKRLSGMKLLE